MSSEERGSRAGWLTRFLPRSDEPLVGRRSISRSSVVVSIGLLLTNLIGAGQALVLIFLVGESESTDAFLAAYSLYTPFALLGVSMRRSLVPLLGSTKTEAAFRDHAARIVARVVVLAVAASAAVLLLAPLLARLLTQGLSSDGQRLMCVVLAVLVPAAFLQIYAGALSATLNALKRFPFSITLYVASGLVALACSTILVALIGVLGSAIGLVIGGSLLGLTHTVYIRRLGIWPRPRFRLLRDRAQGRLAFYLVAGAALGGAQQLSVALALSAVSDVPGAITLYAYAYFMIGMLLNLSSLPLSLVTLPYAVEAIAERGRSAVEEQLVAVTPFVFAVLAPLLAAFAALGEPLVTLVFSSALSSESIAELFDLAVILALMALPTSLYVVGGSLLLALREWRTALAVGGATVALQAVAVFTLAPPGPVGVAAAHAGAAAVAALILLGALHRRRTPLVLATVVRRSVPAFALAAVFALARLPLGAKPGLAAVLVALGTASFAYVALAILLWPSVSGAFVRLVRRPLR